jgi:hypothetical protein
MKKLIIILLLPLFLLSSCASTARKSVASVQTAAVDSLKDGSSFEKAILINAKNEQKGIDAEYAYILQQYPGYQLKGQRLVENKKVPYDIIDIITAGGEVKSLYFNISGFFGKF